MGASGALLVASGGNVTVSNVTLSVNNTAPPAARAGRRVARAVVAAGWAGTAAIPVAVLAAAELVVGRMAATELSALPVRPAL